MSMWPCNQGINADRVLRPGFERKPAWAEPIAWISFAAAVIVFLTTVVHAGGVVDPGIWRGRDIKNGKRDWQVGVPAETPPQHGSPGRAPGLPASHVSILPDARQRAPCPGGAEAKYSS